MQDNESAEDYLETMAEIARKNSEHSTSFSKKWLDSLCRASRSYLDDLVIVPTTAEVVLEDEPRSLDSCGRVGILLLGGTGSRLRPLTNVLHKHLCPLFDLPMCYWSLDCLHRSGVEEIVAVVDPSTLDTYRTILGDKYGGTRIHYAVQGRPNGLAAAVLAAEPIAAGRKVVVMLGDNLLLGIGLNDCIRRASQSPGMAVMTLVRPSTENYEVVVYDGGVPIQLIHKQSTTQSYDCIVGMLFYDEYVFDLCRQVKESKFGEFELHDVHRAYLANQHLSAIPLPETLYWDDLGTKTSLFRSSCLIRDSKNNLLRSRGVWLSFYQD